MTDWGGYWTEVKLEVLRKYLVAFNTASIFGAAHARKARHAAPAASGAAARATTVSGRCGR